MNRLNRIRWLLSGALLLSVGVPARAQVITDFEPKYGSSGDAMLIYGSGFATGPIFVEYWNGVPLVDALITSDTVITVNQVPPGISTGPIRIKRGVGSWNYSADIFTDVGPGPFITRLEPGYGSPPTAILIHGAHFDSDSVVKFGGVTGTSYPNAAGTLLTANVPAISPGEVTLTVTSSGITFTNPEPFTVVGAGPYIDTFTPKAGSDSTPVTLTGLHFTGATSVKFNGKEASLIVPSGDIQLTAWAPSGVTTGPISITTAQGSDTSAEIFYGPIRLGGFSPSIGPVGTQVVISGTNFTGTTSVKFGGFAGATAPFVVNNNNQITATVPTNASTDLIVITTPTGALPTSSNFVVTPTITSFTPSKGQAGTPVQINGTRLVDNGGAAPIVKFNGVNANVIGHNAQQVLVTAPVSASGFITLTTGDGTAISPVPFYYSPQITGFTPNSDPPGATVVISGQSLTNTSSVLFGGVPSTNFIVVGNTSIQAEVPFGVNSGPITVVAPGGTANSTALYYALPAIAAFAPASGEPGTSVTVFGNNFLGATSVRFNGVTASFSGVQNSQLTAVVPGGAATGPISVTAPAGTATSAEAFVVPQVADLRVNTFNHTPDPVTVGSDLTLTIVAANDGPNPAGGVSAAVTLAPGQVVKSTQVPAGATVDTNGNPVVFSLGTVNGATGLPGYSQFKLVVAPHLPGPATNTVTLSSTTLDPDPGNNTDTRVTTVLPEPELKIERVGGDQVRVAWPAALAGYVLQSTAGLTNGVSWGDVAGPPVIEGDEKVITEPGTGVTKFYRLNLPPAP